MSPALAQAGIRERRTPLDGEARATRDLPSMGRGRVGGRASPERRISHRSESRRMQFEPEQIIVHPHHGPATITAIETRKLRGTDVQYLRLQVHKSNLEIQLPVASAEEVGLRPVAGSEQLKLLIDVLGAPTSTSQAQGWSRRFKENMERARTGNLFTMAGVVRDLTRRQQEQGISLGEKDLLAQVTRPLRTEVALACNTTEEDAEKVIVAIIFQAEMPAVVTRTIAELTAAETHKVAS